MATCVPAAGLAPFPSPTSPFAFGELTIPVDWEASLLHRRPGKRDIRVISEPSWARTGSGPPPCRIFLRDRLFPPFLHIWQMVPPFSPPQWSVKVAVEETAATRAEGASQVAGCRGRAWPRSEGPCPQSRDRCGRGVPLGLRRAHW